MNHIYWDGTMRQRTLAFCVALATATLLLRPETGSAAAEQTPVRSEMKTFTLGLVSAVNQKEIAEHFREFAQYVARKLSVPTTEGEGSVAIAPTLPELAKLLAENKVDFFMESPYPTYIVNHVHGAAKLLLRRWKGGKPEYRSLIATHRDSNTIRLQDLRGKIVAFEDPESTSGYFLPKFFLQRNGFKLSQVASENAKVPTTEIGYVFGKTRENLINWVLSKQVAAVALSDDDYATLDNQRKANLNILAQTELLPRHLVSVRKNLAWELIERLGHVLLSMKDDEEGRKILRGIDTTQFDVLPGGEEIMRRRLLDTFHTPDKR
jgi:phosphonate transport system substrate-binding protein